MDGQFIFILAVLIGGVILPVSALAKGRRAALRPIVVQTRVKRTRSRSAGWR
jgi:hypothetical protein